MAKTQLRTILEASLYEESLLIFETGFGELAGPRHISSHPDAWKLTGAWKRDRSRKLEGEVDGYRIERWLRGLRPQNGARSAQTARARERLRALGIRRSAPDQGDIVWATPHMEYPGAVRFRSLLDSGEELAAKPVLEHALSAGQIEDLLDQVIAEMRRGTIDPRMLAVQPITPSGSLPKFAVHRSPEDGRWRLPDRTRLSTHIVKHEDRADLPAEAAIESICQRSLRLLGVRAAATEARIIGHRQVIVSERSDRFVDPTDATVRAIHQEEWACACGRDPDDLIQRRGANGGWADLYRFLTERSTDRAAEQEHFWTALAAIALLGHRDAHRRNVAVRYPRPDAPHCAELAPLYDVASMDGQGDPRWRSLGLPIGGEEELDRIGETAWIRMAHECRADPEQVLGLVTETARRLPDAVEDAIRQARDQDEWRAPAQALQRIEALRRGLGRRAGKALRPTRHPQRAPAAPEWIDRLIPAMEAGHAVRLEANEKNRKLVIAVRDKDGVSTRIGTAESPSAYYRALRRAGVVAPEDVPSLERTLERERKRQVSLAMARKR